uniref:glutathione transferase n=1 Tax=Culicoides sonorensis TaxID=179676 RepID=A0A336L7V9_CULSO
MSTLSSPILYFDNRSPPVRSVLLVINYLNIPVEYKLIDLFKVEHLKEEFLKINPFHTVPCLKHNELLLTDSHAILMYLCDFYGKGSLLEIKTEKDRALIMNFLMFNATILFEREKIIMRKIFVTGSKEVDPKEVDAVEEAVDYLNKILGESEFVAGNQVSIADLSIVASFSTINLVLTFLEEKYQNVSKWFKKMKQLPCYEKGNQEGLNALQEVMDNICQGELKLKSKSEM